MTSRNRSLAFGVLLTSMISALGQVPDNEASPSEMLDAELDLWIEEVGGEETVTSLNRGTTEVNGRRIGYVELAKRFRCVAKWDENCSQRKTYPVPDGFLRCKWIFRKASSNKEWYYSIRSNADSSYVYVSNAYGTGKPFDGRSWITVEVSFFWIANDASDADRRTFCELPLNESMYAYNCGTMFGCSGYKPKKPWPDPIE